MGRPKILEIKAVTDSRQGVRGLQKLETQAERTSRRVGRAGKIGAVGLLALGAAGLNAAKNAASDRQAQVLLAKAMTNAAGATKAQLAQTEKFIAAQSRAAGVSDDELRPAMAALVRSTGNVSKAQGELRAALDVAAATGKPVEQVANAIAKAHGGQTTALSRLVPGIDRAAIKSKDMNKIMAELARTTGGSAAAAAKTEAGELKRMQINVDEAREAIGGFLLPVLGTLATVLANSAQFLENNSKAVIIVTAVLGGLALTVVTINAAYRAYQATLLAVETIKKLSVISTAAQSVATTAYAGVIIVGTAAQLAFAAATRAVGAAMAANPLGAAIVAIGIVIGLLVLAYKKSSTFRAIVQAAGRGAAAAMGWIITKAKAVVQWLGKLGPAANKGKEIAVKAFKLYTLPIRTVIDLVKKLIGWLGKIKFPKVPGAIKKLGGLFGGGGAPSPPKAPPAAPGGSAPGWGRGGPGGGGFSIPAGGGNTGGGDTYIIIQGAVDQEGTARQLRRILYGSKIRNGNWVATA